MYSGHHTSRPPSPCIVVCQGWPSILPVLPTLHLQCVHLFIDWSSSAPSARALLSNIIVPHPLLSSSTMRHVLKPSWMLLIQGPPSLWHQLPSLWRRHTKTIYFVDAGSPLPLLPLDLLYRQWSHASVDGVSDGHWFVGTYKQNSFTEPVPPQRTAKHIVDATVAGHPALGPPPAFSDRDRLPTANPMAEFHLPCFYSPVGVYRSLSLRELGRAFDVPSAALAFLSLTDLPFVMRSCPGKLITFAGSTCLYSPGGAVYRKHSATHRSFA